MKPEKQAIIAYKAMMESSLSMEEKCKDYLTKHCTKFNQDLMERCMKYLTECAKEILNSTSGEVPDDVCYTICMDYFNDEIWKLEDKEKAEKEAKEAEKKRKQDQIAKDKKTKMQDIFSCSIDDIDDADDEEEIKETVKEPAPKKPETIQLSLF